MTLPLKDLLRSSGKGIVKKDGRTDVIVDLKSSAADAACLSRLKDLGLSIRSVHLNKIIGSIDAERLPALRRDANVREVEESVQLKAH